MSQARAARTPAINAMHELHGKALWTAITGIMLGLLLSSLDQTVVGTALPRIVDELHGFNHYSWVATAYLLASTAAVPVFGKLSDSYGRKWFYIGGMIWFMAASALCGLSQSMTQLIVFRGIQGIGGGILMANAFAIIGDLFPPAERGKWQGLTGAVFGLSSVVGPTLGGWLTDGPGWRWVFYINLPVGILAVIVLFIGLPQIRTRETKPVDWWGAATIVAATVSLLLAFTWAGTEYAWSSPQIVGLLVLAAAITGLFLFIETRAVDPMLSLHFFKNRTFTVSVISMFLLAAGMFGAIIYLPLFVQEVIGTSATNSGIVLTPMMLSLVVASTTSGQIISRTGRYKWSVVGGLSLMVIGMALLAMMDVHATNGTAVRNMIVLGLGIGMTLPTLTLVVQNAFPPSEIGVVTAAVQFFRSIGATIGVALMGTLLTQQMTANMKANLTPDIVKGVSPQLLGQMNPQVLGSPDARDQVIAAFKQIPNGLALFAKVEGIVRVALANAMHDVFLVGTALAVIAVIVGVFLPETPLRKKNTAESHAATATASSGQPRLRVPETVEAGPQYD